MTKITTATRIPLVPSLEVAWQGVESSFECFCLTAGIGALERMLCEDAEQLAGAPHSRSAGRVGHRWGLTKGKIGFHGGRVTVHRPRIRSYEGQEIQRGCPAPLLNFAGRALPVDEAMRLSRCPQVWANA